jgi:hypothetical protein
MAALNVEQYRNQVAKVIDRWWAKVADCAKRITQLNNAIAELQKKLDCATPEGEKKFKADIDKLKAERNKVLKEIEAADLSLRIELMLIEPPEKTKANEKEFLKLPGFIGDLVEKKGVPLGKTGVVLKPDVDFDFKAGKLKKFAIELKVEW